MGKKKKRAKERKGKKKPSKSKHKNVKNWEKYKENKKNKFCPRCGPGVFLAEHKNRVTCGKCKYSEIKVKKT